jgi:hypothetical protein
MDLNGTKEAVSARIIPKNSDSDGEENTKEQLVQTKQEPSLITPEKAFYRVLQEAKLGTYVIKPQIV